MRLALTGIFLALTACATAPEVLPFEVKSVPAVAETDPMPGAGDLADDPAVWVAPVPANSLVLGTNKDTGLYVYGLDGKEKQFLPVGRLNNVDVRGNLAAGSNDETGAISWFDIEPSTQTVTHIIDTPVERVEPYGACLGMVEGKPLAVATYKDGSVEMWSPVYQDGRITSATLARTAKLESQLEGCVFDDEAATLFIGEEAHGIWALDLSDPKSLPVEVDTIAAGNGLVEDTEGLSLWNGPDGEGYLVASAQAANRYVVYDRKAPYTPRGIFSISESLDGSVDNVTHTDGLDISSAAFPQYPQGVLVVQDDANPKGQINQNFKLVDWADVSKALELE